MKNNAFVITSEMSDRAIKQVVRSMIKENSTPAGRVRTLISRESRGQILSIGEQEAKDIRAVLLELVPGAATSISQTAFTTSSGHSERFYNLSVIRPGTRKRPEVNLSARGATLEAALADIIRQAPEVKSRVDIPKTPIVELASALIERGQLKEKSLSELVENLIRRDLAENGITV